MKLILKEYGTLVGPSLAFLLGVIAVGIKYLLDKRLDKWQSNKKFQRLILIIYESAPPKKYYPRGGENDMHADQARNGTNLAIFSTRLNVLEMYIAKIENDILLNSSIQQVQQFNQIKFIVNYLINNVEKFKNAKKEGESRIGLPYLKEWEFKSIAEDYNRILKVCNNPKSEFQYIE